MNNTITDRLMTENINNFLFKATKNVCSADYIARDLDNKPCIIKLIDTSDEKTKAIGVTPFNSHPHRYVKAWPMFIQLIDSAKVLGGYLYVINYDSKDDSEYAIIKILDYIPENISNIVNYEFESNYPYLKFESQKLGKQDFDEWVHKLNEVNRKYKNSLYKKFRTITTTNYYKDPKPSEDHLGKHYDSFNQMCNAYNLKSATVRDRLKRGWSIERALTEEPKKK